MLNHIWQQPRHRSAFVTIAGQKQRFVGFANGIINHSNHLLTEALGKLAEIRATELEMADTVAWAALPKVAPVHAVHYCLFECHCCVSVALVSLEFICRRVIEVASAVV